MKPPILPINSSPPSSPPPSPPPSDSSSPTLVPPLGLTPSSSGPSSGPSSSSSSGTTGGCQSGIASPPGRPAVRSTSTRNQAHLSDVVTLRSGGLKDRLRSLANHAHQLLSPSRPMFYSHVFDPPLIVGQIIALQACYWFSLSVSINVFSLFSQSTVISLASLFDPTRMEIESPFFSLASVFAFFFADISTAYVMLVLVERSKKCLDFVATIHLYHFAVVLAYSHSFPGLFWWGCWFLSLLIMFGLSFWWCQLWETQAIQIDPKKKGSNLSDWV